MGHTNPDWPWYRNCFSKYGKWKRNDSRRWRLFDDSVLLSNERKQNLTVITVPFQSGVAFNYKPSPPPIGGSWHYLFPNVSIKSVPRENKWTGKHAKRLFPCSPGLPEYSIWPLRRVVLIPVLLQQMPTKSPKDSIPLWSMQESNLTFSGSLRVWVEIYDYG